MKDFQKVKKIKCPIYPITIIFSMLNNEGIKTLEDNHPGSEAHTVLQDQEVYIYVRENANMATVAHELFHATEFIMARIGQPLSPSPNETWAYLIEYLTEQYLIFIKK